MNPIYRAPTTVFWEALLPNPKCIGQTSRSPVRRALTTLAAWNERHRSRKDLLKLDARLLADIGMTCDAACKEAEKPFWQE